MTELINQKLKLKHIKLKQYFLANDSITNKNIKSYSLSFNQDTSSSLNKMTKQSVRLVMNNQSEDSIDLNIQNKLNDKKMIDQQRVN